MTTDDTTPEVAEPAKAVATSKEKHVKKRPLQFMDLSVDIKSLIVSHVRSR
jgi:hypothetical protein